MENSQSPAGQTANPQTVVSSNIQQPGQQNLQTDTVQSIPDINTLDSSGRAIAISGVSGATASPSSFAPSTSRASQNLWLDGGLGLLIVAFLVILYYGLRRQT